MQVTCKKNAFSRMLNFINENKMDFIAFLCAAVIFVIYCQAKVAFATEFEEALQADAKSFMDLILLIAKLIGYIFAVLGAVQFILARINDNPAQESPGLMKIFWGFVLISIRLFAQSLSTVGTMID